MVSVLMADIVRLRGDEEAEKKDLAIQTYFPQTHSLPCRVCMAGDAWLWSLQPISLQDTTLKEYSVKGSITSLLLTLNMKELPVVIRALAVRFIMDSMVVLMLRPCNMKFSTGRLPSNVGVHLTATQRGPKSKAVTLDGGSGRSEITA